MEWSADDLAILKRLEDNPHPNPTQPIDWGEGKEKNITAKTWQLPSQEDRLKSAKLDLARAGCEDAAKLLTVSRLNGVWSTKLSAEDQKRYKTARDEFKEDKSVETKKRGACFSSLVSSCLLFLFTHTRAGRKKEANNNTAIAASLGLGGPSSKKISLDDYGAAHGLNASAPTLPGMEDVRGFQLRIEQDDVEEDPTISRAPLTGSVLIEKNRFDVKGKDVMILRVSGAGIGATVSPPQRLNEKTLSVHVQRSNTRDIAEWLKPNGTVGDLAQIRKDIEATCHRHYGTHMDYDMFNNAYQKLVPQMEGWTVIVDVLEPYQIGDASNIFVIRGQGGVDAFIVVPLVREQPDVLVQPMMMDL